MGVGALIRQYLKDSHDYNSPEISSALRNLGASLQNVIDNSLSSVNEDIVIASLKGLENAQYINDDLEDSIVKTIMSDDVSQRIRAAALAVAKTYATYSKVRRNTCAVSYVFRPWSCMLHGRDAVSEFVF